MVQIAASISKTKHFRIHIFRNFPLVSWVVYISFYLLSATCRWDKIYIQDFRLKQILFKNIFYCVVIIRQLLTLIRVPKTKKFFIEKINKIYNDVTWTWGGVDNTYIMPSAISSGWMCGLCVNISLGIISVATNPGLMFLQNKIIIIFFNNEYELN